MKPTGTIFELSGIFLTKREKLIIPFQRQQTFLMMSHFSDFFIQRKIKLYCLSYNAKLQKYVKFHLNPLQTHKNMEVVSHISHMWSIIGMLAYLYNVICSFTKFSLASLISRLH